MVARAWTQEPCRAARKRATVQPTKFVLMGLVKNLFRVVAPTVIAMTGRSVSRMFAFANAAKTVFALKA